MSVKKPDPRVHVGLDAEGTLTFDVISQDKIVFSFSMAYDGVVDALMNVEHVQPCTIRPLDTPPE